MDVRLFRLQGFPHHMPGTCTRAQGYLGSGKTKAPEGISGVSAGAGAGSG